MYGRRQVVCDGIWQMLTPETRQRLKEWRMVDPKVLGKAERWVLELARTVKSQRPKPLHQEEMFALPGSALDGRLK
jgi:DNA-binding TFAR19-related protein (PDSD5 family)